MRLTQLRTRRLGVLCALMLASITGAAAKAFAYDGVTDLAFLCNERGGIYGVQVTYTNAVLNQPFLLANAAIQILGNLVIDNYKDRMSREQLRLAHEFVDHADSKGLIELTLMLGESARD